jgi:hypothetical protein
LGQRKIGKTREAIELIRKCISNDLLTEDNIFELSTTFRFYNSSELKEAIKATINLQRYYSADFRL